MEPSMLATTTCISSAQRSLAKNMVLPQRLQKPRRASGVERCHETRSSPSVKRKAASATPNQVTKAAPWAARHRLQWQCAHHFTGKSTSKRTPPQRQWPEVDVVSLTDLSQNFAQTFLGSLSGHLSFISQQVGSGATDAHDATFGDGNNSRNRGVHGWIVQNAFKGRAVVRPDQPTVRPAPPGQNAFYGVPEFAAWGRPLSQGRTALVPFLTDQPPVLDADNQPPPPPAP